MIYPVTPQLIQAHRRLGDARLLRWLGRFSIGQSVEALHELVQTVPAAENASTKRLAQTLQAKSATLLTILDSEYPGCLRALDTDAPPFLYVIGDAARLETRSIAIIGSRWPTRPGRESVDAVASAMAESQWTVVSGNAPGIDARAHESSLSAGGETLVFPPVPLDRYKPIFRGGVADRITVASPFVPGARVDPWMFLRRNTLVAIQCRVAFVAETGSRGGTLDTVRKLHKFRRRTFATMLPPDARFIKAHAMLAAGGVSLIDTSQSIESWIGGLIEAGEECLCRPPVNTAVLDDFFPEGFS